MLELEIEELTQVPWRLATQRYNSMWKTWGGAIRGHEERTVSGRMDHTFTSSIAPVGKSAKNSGAFRPNVTQESESKSKK